VGGFIGRLGVVSIPAVEARKSPKVACSAAVSLPVTLSEVARRRDVLDEAVAECQDRTT